MSNYLDLCEGDKELVAVFGFDSNGLIVKGFGAVVAVPVVGAELICTTPEYLTDLA